MRRFKNREARHRHSHSLAVKARRIGAANAKAAQHCLRCTAKTASGEWIAPKPVATSVKVPHVNNKPEHHEREVAPCDVFHPKGMRAFAT